MNDRRPVILIIFVALIGLVLLVKLFMIQVADDSFLRKAERNAIQRIVDHPYRGLIYDRNNALMVFNNPVFDLMVIPKEFSVKDTARFCDLFGIEKEQLIENFNAAKEYSWVKPSSLIKQISNEEFARIQDFLIDYPGLFVTTRSVRAYPQPSAANALGYIGEIGPNQLNRDSSRYYRQGDYIGISGLEGYYEKELRGRKGVVYKMVNVRGVDKGSFKNGDLDTASIAGKNIQSTIDLHLQGYGEKLMEGKRGSIVAIEPKTGEILSLISAPTYDPNMLAGSKFGENYLQLNAQESKPLFNRPIMATYPPGSIFKVVQSLIGLQDGTLNPNSTFACHRYLVNCHNHPNPSNLFGAIRNSCNPYYHQAFRLMINKEVSSNTYIDTQIGLDE